MVDVVELCVVSEGGLCLNWVNDDLCFYGFTKIDSKLTL